MSTNCISPGPGLTRSTPAQFNSYFTSLASQSYHAGENLGEVEEEVIYDTEFGDDTGYGDDYDTSYDTYEMAEAASDPVGVHESEVYDLPK
jgi:hypothetical protein